MRNRRMPKDHLAAGFARRDSEKDSRDGLTTLLFALMGDSRDEAEREEIVAKDEETANVDEDVEPAELPEERPKVLRVEFPTELPDASYEAPSERQLAGEQVAGPRDDMREEILAEVQELLGRRAASESE